MSARNPAALVALVVVAAITTADEKHDSPKQLKTTASFSGSVDDASAEAPKMPVLTRETDLRALWSGWKLTDKMPKVDFEKAFVLVTTTGGSSLDVVLQCDAKGDVQVTVEESADSPPGLRYLIHVIPREGIKSVNGKKLPEAKAPR